MIAAAAIVAVADGVGGTRLTTLRSQAPLVLRTSRDVIYIVNAAGGPLGGDRVTLTIDVGAGATVTVRTVAAAVAQPSYPSAFSSYAVSVRVGRGATFTWMPEPTVIADGARHHTSLDLVAEEGARLTVRESVVLGRYGEAGGEVTSTVRVDLAGQPLLRQSVDVAGADDCAIAVLGRARAVGSMLVVDPAWDGGRPAAAPSCSPEMAVLSLAGPGVLVTALAGDSARLASLFDQALCELSPDSTSLAV